MNADTEKEAAFAAHSNLRPSAFSCVCFLPQRLDTGSLLRGGTKRSKFALRAVRIPREAPAASVPDELVTELGPVGTGHELDQSRLDFHRVGFGGHAQSLREAGHVGVHDDAFLEPECVAQDDVRGLASHAVERDELRQGAGNLPSVP